MTAQPDGRPFTSRRAFLAGAGGAALAARIGAAPRAAATPDVSRLEPFAMITDTHTNPEEPGPIKNLQLVFDHLRQRDPAFILHCGDITDYGSPADLDTYLGLVPEELADRIHTVPGNHEEQWNADAMEAYRDRFGELRSSVRTGGYQVIGLDPMVALEEVPLHFGREQLDWLNRELEDVPDDVPAICFLHFPLSSNWHFVDDSDDFLTTIRPHPVRAIFAGHTHKINFQRFNGASQVIGGPIKNHATYVWAEPKSGQDGPYLEITKIDLSDDGQPMVTPVGTVPLTGKGAGADLGPYKSDAVNENQAALVNVTLPVGAGDAAVQAQVFPQGGAIPADGWQTLTRSGRSWSGSVAVDDLAPGRHRMMIRAVADDAIYDATTPLAIGGGTARVAWTQQLPERIHGALAERRGVVVAGSVAGGVHAVRATSRSARLLWRADVGPVFKRPVFSGDGDKIIVGSADHRLYALDPSNGRTIWRRDLGVPVLSDPQIAMVDGEERVLVTAGNTLFCTTSAGEIVWRTGLNGSFVGAAACDGEQVYAGSSDGRAYALHASTGAVIWAEPVTDKSDSYGKINYGSAAAHPQLLPDGAVLFPVFLDLRSLDRSTGSLRWITDVSTRSAVYTPPLVTDHGILWFDGRDGILHLSETATGKELWTDTTLKRSRSAGPIPTADPDLVWMVALGGTLIRIDLAGRAVEQVLQISPSFTYSTAVLATDRGNPVIISGDQDGRLRAVVGLNP